MVVKSLMDYLSIQLRPTSIEKEIFPAMAADKQLFAFELKGKKVGRYDESESDFRLILIRILDGCWSTERLSDWNGSLS